MRALPVHIFVQGLDCGSDPGRVSGDCGQRVGPPRTVRCVQMPNRNIRGWWPNPSICAAGCLCANARGCEDMVVCVQSIALASRRMDPPPAPPCEGGEFKRDAKRVANRSARHAQGVTLHLWHRFPTGAGATHKGCRYIELRRAPVTSHDDTSSYAKRCRRKVARNKNVSGSLL